MGSRTSTPRRSPWNTSTRRRPPSQLRRPQQRRRLSCARSLPRALGRERTLHCAAPCHELTAPLTHVARLRSRTAPGCCRRFRSLDLPLSVVPSLALYPCRASWLPAGSSLRHGCVQCHAPDGALSTRSRPNVKRATASPSQVVRRHSAPSGVDALGVCIGGNARSTPSPLGGSSLRSALR